MGNIEREGTGAQRGRAAGSPTAGPHAVRVIPAGVSNHLLARVFNQGEKKRYDKSSAKLPRIHGVSSDQLRRLADDERDYGTILNAEQFAGALRSYEETHRVAAVEPPLDERFVGNKTVWNEDEFATHANRTVRATFQLDTGQGKHDAAFASDREARKKGGGQQMPPRTDYAALAQGVPADLTRKRLDQIFAKREREGYDFSVQKETQDDGYQYEISAMWATSGEGRHVLVYYHCYPPR